jgi:hypothetical protein
VVGFPDAPGRWFDRLPGGGGIHTSDSTTSRMTIAWASVTEMTPEQVLALPGFRDRRADAGSTVNEDRCLAMRHDYPLDRQPRDPLE